MKQPAKARRYSVPVMKRAIDLRADGWQLERIADFLEAEHGVRPSIDTIAIWTDPERAESSRRAHTAAIRRFRNQTLTGRMPNSSRHTVDWQEIRAKALLTAGAGDVSVAATMAFDYPGQGWTVRRVAALIGETVQRAPEAAVRQLERRAALEKAAELRRKGWTWSCVALVMAEYHGQDAQVADYWRHAVRSKGLDAPKREMTPAREAQLRRLHAAKREVAA